MKKLYFSYGMNTNLTQMRLRCPQARCLGKAVLQHYKFEFKTHATVTPVFDQQTEGVLWEITPECEASLDKLEAYPDYYNKIIVWANHHGAMVSCMLYLMYPAEPYNYPSNIYLDMLHAGYSANGLNPIQIEQALMDVDYEFGLTYRDSDVSI